MSDVFISYAREDTGFVRQLFERLEQDMCSVWVDWESIPRGEDWLNEIYSGIEQADTFVFAISQHSLTSRICNLELRHAIDNNKRVIPLILQLIEGETLIRVRGSWVDESWEQTARDNWERLKAINWLFFRQEDDFESEYAALIESISSDQQHLREHTRLFLKARDWEENGRDHSFLLRGIELTEAEQWLTTAGGKEPKPDELHTEYILASRQQTNRRQRTLLIIGGITLAISLGLGAISLFLLQESETRGFELIQAIATSERRANEAQSLGLSANAQLAFEQGDSLLALPLALASNEIPEPPILSQRTLANISYHSGIRRVINGFAGEFSEVVFSPDGQYVLTGGCGERVVRGKFWNTQ